MAQMPAVILPVRFRGVEKAKDVALEILAFSKQGLVVARAVTAEVPPDIACIVVKLFRTGNGRLAAVFHLEDLLAFEVLAALARDAQKQCQVLAEKSLGDLIQRLLLP